MNALEDVYRYLNGAIQNDSVLCLAQATCWLDPLWRGHDEDFYEDTDGFLSAALVVTRQSFPDLYVDAIDKLRQGASYSVIDQLICGGISQTGIPLDDLEYVLYGIPLPAYGVVLEDPEFYVDYKEAAPVLAVFGIEPQTDEFSVDVPARAYTTASLLATDLANHPEENYQRVASLLDWLFAMSGNSLVDWDPDTLWETEPLSWEADNLAFARVMIQEADEIMGKAHAGLQWLTENPTVMQALQDNIRQIYDILETKDDTDDTPNVRLEWANF